MAKNLYFIADANDGIVGHWQGRVHYCFFYRRYAEAKKDAIALGIPNYRIGNTPLALSLNPSKYSK